MSSIGSFESSEEDRSEDFDVLHQDLLSSTSSSSLELEDIQAKMTRLETETYESVFSSRGYSRPLPKIVKRLILFPGQVGAVAGGLGRPRGAGYAPGRPLGPRGGQKNSPNSCCLLTL